MASVITGKYLGEKRVSLTHELSGAEILTDAPPDNQGLGRAFSPTDLLASSLGSCILTVIAIVADRSEIDISGAHMRVEKHMQISPRRIGKLPVDIHLPSKLDSEQREKCEKAGRGCPVYRSLLQEIEVKINFIYDVS